MIPSFAVSYSSYYINVICLDNLYSMHAHKFVASIYLEYWWESIPARDFDLCTNCYSSNLKVLMIGESLWSPNTYSCFISARCEVPVLNPKITSQPRKNTIITDELPIRNWARSWCYFNRSSFGTFRDLVYLALRLFRALLRSRNQTGLFWTAVPQIIPIPWSSNLIRLVTTVLLELLSTLLFIHSLGWILIRWSNT